MITRCHCSMKKKAGRFRQSNVSIGGHATRCDESPLLNGQESGEGKP